MAKKHINKRLLWVDCVRGLAIVLMIIFHFCYDLRYFGYVNWSIPNGNGWWQFRYVILTLFIVTVGVSLVLAHGVQFRKNAFYKRLWQLLAASAAITIMSLFLFPNAWIYFGILHFIAASSILAIGLVRFPQIALLIAAVILVGYWLGLLKFYWPFNFFQQWLPEKTEDFVPLIPWFGVMLLGIAFAHFVPIKKIILPHNKLTDGLVYMGKHGLIIYLIHQPILFAGFFIIRFLSA